MSRADVSEVDGPSCRGEKFPFSASPGEDIYPHEYFLKSVIRPSVMCYRL